MANDEEADNRRSHVWFSEPKVPVGSVLTASGVTQIAHHKYKGSTYTFLDLTLNPWWTSLTEKLPLTLAPNSVTALGGSFCLFSYVITAYYNFDFQQYVPDWLLVLNGLCLFAYYTFDCMDGKQARRTKASSPLGQLFDHGVDCVSNLSHVSLMQSILRLNGVQFLWLQTTLQLGFFQAQWEEYYTGKMVHAAGNVGTTEVLYGISAWAVGNGLGILDRTFYAQPIPDVIAYYMLQVPFSSFILGPMDTPELMNKDFFILFWVYGYCILALLSFARVFVHISGFTLASALTKLFSPLSLCVLGVYLGNEIMVSKSTIGGGVRLPSLCIGLIFCIITVKLIVFGMGRMSFASFQLDILPFGLLCTFYKLLSRTVPSEQAILVLQLLLAFSSLAYLVRLVVWTKVAMRQICKRLHIQPFSLKKRVE